ncbi:MAG TPA: flagellar basal body P-ring formation chaperone FlgA [Phycisphaerales bacterium]|nr:flagellar basal body P-ring formation chaperone FlgA [Phycisphaerales bacterium]
MRQDAEIVNGTLMRRAPGAPWWVWPLAGLGMLLCAAVASAQTHVVLKPAATISSKEPGHAITLADIAEIDPPTTPDGEKLAEIVVVANPVAGGMTIGVAQVRSAMDAAQVLWARITLRGSACQVSFGDGGGQNSDSAKTTPRPSLGLTTPQPVDLGGVPTIRTAIASRLLSLYEAGAQDLRLAFDAADEDFLNQPIGDRRVDVQPAATGASARTPVNVFIYEGDRLTAAKLISTQALVNRPVVNARGPISRGEAISPNAVESTRQWVSPNAKPSVTAEEAAGQIASRNIVAGATITASDITQPVVCKRGDIVWVHVLSGGMSVKAKSRAMEQGRDGERIHFKLDGSNRVFIARLCGPGRAVMIAGDGDGDGNGEPAKPESADRPPAQGRSSAIRAIRSIP